MTLFNFSNSARKREARLGFASATPLGVFLAVFFLGSLLLTVAFSFMPSHIFELQPSFTLEQYQTYFSEAYYESLLWSLGLAFAATAISFILCYPLAYGMAKVFGKFTWVLTIGIVLYFFVPADIRIFGWMLALMNGGMVPGFLQAWFGIAVGSPLYSVGIIVFGLFYNHYPFMLFPILYSIATISDEVRLAASDLGASPLRVFTVIDLPLAMPGIVVGWVLTFALSVGSIVSAKVLSGGQVIVVTQDIKTAFNYAQNWPFGSAISVWVILAVFATAVFVLRRVDLDKIMGRTG